MTKKKEFCLISLLLIFTIVFGNVVSVADFHNNATIASEPEKKIMLEAGTPHGPIVIDGDANFSATALAEGWFGDGSYETPYVIDGLDIDIGGATGHCISISNTRANFTISNCNLAGASVNPGSGIYLNNVNNAELINNTCIDSYRGIELINSDFNSVRRNNCTNNSWGIRLYYADSNNVTYNDINHSDVAGIDILSFAASNRIGYNTLIDNHVGIIDSSSNLTTIHNNNCSNGVWGIYLIVNENCVVSNNTCTNNTFAGITSQSATDVILTNNTCSDNGHVGIEVIDSWNIEITNCTSTNNQNNLLYEDNEGGSVTWNAFVGGLISNIYVDSTGVTVDHNYYSDYAGADGDNDGIGDTPHAFSGTSDSHPLMFPPYAPFWLDQPTDQTIELGNTFRYDLNATAQSPITYSVNDTINFVIMEDGVLYSLNPDFGTYGTEIVVCNIYGVSITAEFTLRVVEYLAPSWMSIPENQMLANDEPFDYAILAIDNIGISMWTLNDTVHFSLSSTELLGGSAAQLSNSTPLSVGDYGLNITVYDYSGNSLSALITITVQPPSTTTTTSTNTTSEGIDPLLSFGAGAGVSGVVLLVIVFALSRRKP